MNKTASNNRRIGRGTFLKGAGAVLVLVAGGGVYRALDQGVFSAGRGPAYRPWEDWREGDGPFAAVSAAILASNPHNSQPWLFRVTDVAIDLYADTRRNIGKVDPFLREMYVGVGCALENLVLAAQAGGYAPDVTLMPDREDPTHAARVVLEPAERKASPLYEAIPDRHTNRAAYDTGRVVPPRMLEEMRALGTDPDVTVFWFTGDEERREIADLTVEATEAFNADRQQSHDSHVWFRHDWDDLQRHADGVTIDAQSLPSWITAGGKVLPAQSAEASGESWLSSTRDTHVSTAAAFGLLAVRDSRDNAQRLEGGRLWQRMHLWATTKGLAMQPLNQMCERADREAETGTEPRFGDALRELIGDPTWQALMPFRAGYPTVEANPSPRRPAREVVA